MQDNPSIKLTLEQRKLILELMNYSYTIPPEYHECVADAIKRYATKSYSEETINKMVRKSQSIAHSGFLIREDNLSLFRGKFAEWLACIEYNSLKNSGSVIMTIINPDETSKADLLHFIKIGDEFKAVAGPDIKSGGSTYVFNQWKKIVTSRHDIPMVDFDDVLTTEEGLKQLTKKQREEFDELSKQYPQKKPIPSAWSNQDELRLRLDYFKNILDMDGDFEYSPEVTQVLKGALSKQSNEKLLLSDWTEFNRKCKEIFVESNFERIDIESPKDRKLNASEGKISKVPTESGGYKSQTKPIKITHEKRGIIRRSIDSVIKTVKTNKGLILKVGLGSVATVAGVALIKNPDTRDKLISSALSVVDNVVANDSYDVSRDKETSANYHIMSEVAFEDEAYSEKRASPIQHDVRPYFRKNGTEVQGYKRGIPKEE